MCALTEKRAVAFIVMVFGSGVRVDLRLIHVNSLIKMVF